MFEIPEYKLREKIYDGPYSQVYRGNKSIDNKPVIFKVLEQMHHYPQQRKRFQNSYEINSSLDTDSVVKTYSLENYDDRLVMVMEDFGGDSLKTILSERKINIKELISLAIKAAKIIRDIHNHNVIHKDIKTSNFIYNFTTQQLKIIDFGISTISKREIIDTYPIEATLAYMSPEQTGKMNRSLDHRTDLYSLGMAFYEWFTGRLPFDIDDPLELVHSHLAVQPAPPHKINENIPEQVSAIIMKLLSKSPEDRYQSARGLQLDLEECYKQLCQQGHVDNFNLGEHDILHKFTIPEKLYGREDEIELLMKSFDNAGKGEMELLLVSGYSGVGKSVLAHEVQQQVAMKNGYFLSGKFSQLDRNIAYNAVTQSFRSLIKQILGESGRKIKTWEEMLLSALGINGQVIIDVIPEVEHIIGKQPSVQNLPPLETQNRFHIVFINFIKVFAHKEHPLVIFLDDLQWADLASLNLIKLLTTNDEIKNLLIIGSYRDNEVDESHPTIMTINEIKKQGATVNNIILSPLDKTNVNRLVADTLSSPPEKTIELADLIFKKTGGNPFFIKSVLQSLYDEKMLIFTQLLSGVNKKSAQYQWQWDLEKIRQIQATSNVAELYVNKMNKMPETTVDVLKVASCFGNFISIKVLSEILEKAKENMSSFLIESLKTEIVYKSENGLRFIHDRVQEAAYSLMTEEEQKKIHLLIGSLLLKDSKVAIHEENNLEALKHLNISRALITDEEEKIKLAELNLQFAKRAKDSAAFNIALEYVNIGLEFLAGYEWEYQYELTFFLYSEQAEILFLLGNFEHCEAIITLLLDKAKSNIEKSNIYIMKINLYSFISKYPEAIEIGRKALDLLGMTFPQVDEGLMPQVELLFKDIFKDLGDSNVLNLVDLPEAEDSIVKSQLNILSALLPITYYVNPGLLAYSAGWIVYLSIQHGNSPTSPAGYSFFGVLLVVQGKYELGFQFGNMSIKLAEKYQVAPLIAMACHMFSACINHWRKPVKLNIDLAQQGYKIGVESGDLQWSSYTRVPQCQTSLFLGINLEEFLQIVKQGYSVGEKNKNEVVCQALKPFIQFALNLRGETKDRYSFETEEFDEGQFLAESQTTALMAIAWFHHLKTRVLYLHENYKKAVEHSEKMEEFMPYCPGQLINFDAPFYSVLCQLAIYTDLSTETKDQYLKKIETNMAQIKTYAENCPENYQGQYLLVQAEYQGIMHRTIEAMELYENAIETAKKSGFVQNEALGNELYAKFWLKLGRKKSAAIYLYEAYYLYKQWGASIKLDTLVERYEDIISEHLTKDFKNKTKTITKGTSVTSAGTTDAESLDLIAIMKASQAISSNINLGKLLSRMIKIIVNNAGAQKGFLIRNVEDGAYIEVATKIDTDEEEILKPTPIDESENICKAIVYYVIRSGKEVVLHNASREGNFKLDPYIQENKVKSVLCIPFHYKNKIYGALYLENNLIPLAFTQKSVELLQVLLAQVVISMKNAELYESIEKKKKDLSHSNKLLESINVLFQKTLQCKTEKELAITSLKLSEELTGSKFGMIGEINKQGRFDTIAISDPGWKACKMSNSHSIKPFKNIEIRGILGIVFKSNKSQIINNPEFHPEATGVPKGHPKLTSFLGVPLKQGKRTFGMIALANKDSGYDEVDKKTIESFSSAFVEALMRKRSEIELKRHHDNLEKTIDVRTAELIKSEQRLRNIINNIPGIIYNSGTDWIPSIMGKFSHKITGYSSSDLSSGKIKWMDLIHPEDKERILHESLVLNNKPTSITQEYKIKRKDGSIIWVQDRKTSTHKKKKFFEVDGVVLDIDEQKKAEEKLKIAHRKIEVIIRSIDSIFIGLSFDQTITLWNTMSEKVFGIKDNKVLGKKLDCLDIIWDYEILKDAMNECNKSLKAIRCNEIYVYKNNKQMTLGLKVSPIIDENSELTGFLIWGADITERKNMETQITQIQKLESIGQLAAGIAHEINNPIGYLLSNYKHLSRCMNDFSKIIKAYKNVRNKHKDCSNINVIKKELLKVEEIEANLSIDYKIKDIDEIFSDNISGLNKIKDIVAKLKDYSRVGSLDSYKMSDINKAIQDTLIIAHNQIKYHSDVKLELGKITDIKCNIGEINQVLLNIIINAAQAIEEQNRKKRGTITIKTWGDSKNIYCQIIDNGPGIPRKIKDKIFEPFFTTKEVGKGTGLGLNISYDIIVNKHHGNIIVDSEPGKGSKFTIVLPRKRKRSKIDDARK